MTRFSLGPNQCILVTTVALSLKLLHQTRQKTEAKVHQFSHVCVCLHTPARHSRVSFDPLTLKLNVSARNSKQQTGRQRTAFIQHIFQVKLSVKEKFSKLIEVHSLSFNNTFDLHENAVECHVKTCFVVYSAPHFSSFNTS